MALGPGIPEMKGVATIDSQNRHGLSSTHRVQSMAILGGLHHEYTLRKGGISRRGSFLRTTGPTAGKCPEMSRHAPCFSPPSWLTFTTLRRFPRNERILL